MHRRVRNGRWPAGGSFLELLSPAPSSRILKIGRHGQVRNRFVPSFLCVRDLLQVHDRVASLSTKLNKPAPICVLSTPLLLDSEDRKGRVLSGVEQASTILDQN
jgi:hypothetical protein